MRLRLRIERNALPPAQSLWPVNDCKLTISQLLHSINHTFPLEADTWGLEDYSVTVGGYECLHYHEVGLICKEDDEVVIKPLLSADVRARRLTGRDQITRDGRHLLDGVPFGRPALKGPTRPAVHIPPLIKQNMLSQDVDDDEEHLPLEGDVQSSQESEDDSEADEDFMGEDISSPESTDDEDSSPSKERSESGASIDSDSDSSASESTTNSPQKQPASKMPNNTHASAKGVSSTEMTRKRKQQSDADSVSQDDQSILASAAPSSRTGIPFHGSQVTKSRNARRKEQRRLQRLKLNDVLPEDANIAALREYEARQDGGRPRPNNFDNGLTQAAIERSDSEGISSVSGNAPKKQRMLDEEVSSDSDLSSSDSNDPSDSEAEASNSEGLEARRQKLLDDIVAADVAESLAPTARSSITTPNAVTTANTAALAPASSTPRNRLDLAGSQRLVFGSLGVKVPKTDEEKEKLRQKLAGRPTKNTNQSGTPGPADSIHHTNGSQAPADEGQASQETWRHKIHLTAIECCDTRVVKLSQPPFPFQQRWDPQQQFHSKKRAYDQSQRKAGKRGGRGVPGLGHIDTGNDYKVVSRHERIKPGRSYNAQGDSLDYDGADYGNGDQHWQDGPLDGGEDDNEGYEADENLDSYGSLADSPLDDFPSLPEDIHQLRLLSEPEAEVGDYITFSELACEENTGWQPKIVNRKARIAHRITGVRAPWELEMSHQDRKQVVYDRHGDVVYRRFDMPGLEPVPAERKTTWQDLGIVRLLLRPQVTESGTGDGEAGISAAEPMEE